MIAVDSNILVYAHRRDSEWHQRANELVTGLAEETPAWVIPWPCVHEFLAITTHPRIYDPPSSMQQALEQVDAWFDSQSLVLIGESVDHWRQLNSLIADGRVRGPGVHDARIASICLSHGVSELLTSDRDFSRFPSLKTRNPLFD
ncbi:MAG: PIN domain-containing protein [Gammaproteobacteria bacterium]|nr:PIN domain-containing protein [Gammaproteobacteria bacterium]MDE0284466.1 PIN domain-containing protein [Gammaproteobacteria bacterium]MDE0511208.1 PIN domain-containing protein [Gammaproteobacteria bacterium]